MKIDLHMHSNLSDGTDTPEEILQAVQRAGLELFALTDHDGVKGCGVIRAARTADSPPFLCGVEFSCRDEEGKYHILGYGFDPDSEPVRAVVEKGHTLRMRKFSARIDFIRTRFGFTFPEEEIRKISALNNPGKPHIANLMVKFGYAKNKEQAIQVYLNQLSLPNAYVRPEEAIRGILEGGGIPVLAHPSYGSGDELIVGDDMNRRLKKLTGFGLRGVEAFYSGFTPKLQEEMLTFANQYGLYVTAGSDYHGRNKMIPIGHNNLDGVRDIPEGMRRFLADVHRG